MRESSTATRLADATVQDIHFELIRRRWPEVAASLSEHPDLWESVMLNRIQLSQLRKLRSLRGNIWNADELFIFGADSESLRDLLLIAKDDWDGYYFHVFDEETTEDMLGSEEDGRLAVASRMEDYIERFEQEQRCPMAWSDDLNLQDATAQDIQFELLRRMLPSVADRLLELSDLWQAVLLDRVDDLELVTLRDMSRNVWNARDLYILGSNEDAVLALYEESERWRVDDCRVLHPDLGMEYLGNSEILEENGLVMALWWDDPGLIRDIKF
jgi:hypothetical protein